MTEQRRSLEHEIEVEGTPEQVWRAIATGPGISSWYVPHTVEERTGGAASARFGSAPEMEVPGRVAAWEHLALAGRVVEVADHRVSLLVDEPTPGTAFVTIEGMGDQFGISIWSYLYGDKGEAVVRADEPRWQAWLDAFAAS